MLKKPHLLLTNDDGIYAPGLKSLWHALSPYADISIVAPADDASGSGVGITLKNPLRIDRVPWDDRGNTGVRAWKVNGTPADCVKLGVGTLLEERPSLIVSGINRGSNAGRTVFYSGTVGGVIEGALRRIPGIAFSYEETETPDYNGLQKHVLSIVQHALEHPLPLGTILNVNFPAISPLTKGIRFARQGLGYWMDSPDQRTHPTEGTPYFWLGGRWDHHDESHDSDVTLLQQGFVTVVPIRVDELTHHAFIDSHKELFENRVNRAFLP